MPSRVVGAAQSSKPGEKKPVKLKVEFAGLVAIQAQEKRAYAYLLDGSGMVRARPPAGHGKKRTHVEHIPILTIPIDDLEEPSQFEGRPMPRAAGYGGVELALFPLVGWNVTIGTKAKAIVLEKTLPRLRWLYELGEGDLSDYRVDPRAKAVRSEIEVCGGKWRSKAFEPFTNTKFFTAEDVDGEKPRPEDAQPRRFSNAAVWEGVGGSLFFRSRKKGVAFTLGLQPRHGRAVRLCFSSLPVSNAAIEPGLGHFTGVYSVLATPPEVKIVLAPEEGSGAINNGFPRCIPPARL